MSIQLSFIAKPPRITLQPQELKDAVPGKHVTFTVKATGMEPLNYQWQQNVGDEREAWQSCDVERLPGANSSTLTIPSVQKSDEGSYHCVISNSAGSQISEPVHLRIGKIQIVQCNRLCTKCHACKHISIHAADPSSQTHCSSTHLSLHDKTAHIHTAWQLTASRKL